jgi:hypothetical protein
MVCAELEAEEGLQCHMHIIEMVTVFAEEEGKGSALEVEKMFS